MIGEMQQMLPSDMEPLVVESGLHLHPDKLRVALQETIDEITAHTETIILGYGLCSMGVIGLKARHSTLVIPRKDDCIAIFLGSRKVYEEELQKEPGTYFLSRGWIEAGITLVDELKWMEGRYGKDQADRIMKRMLQHYRRLVFIDMGRSNQDRYRRFSRKAAKTFHLAYEEIRGTTRVLEKIGNGPWDDEFVVAPSGHTICLEDFGMVPAGEQQPSGLSIEQNRVKEVSGRQPNPS
ncbi:MAG TPA: DUF1638 domain-containing protein [Acidobacteriota bacterium]|nr:DUF1638 domain-containing protein [Acidobacteriota bacterium]